MLTAVLVMDMIRDFVKGKFESERAESIIPGINGLFCSTRGSVNPCCFGRSLGG